MKLNFKRRIALLLFLVFFTITAHAQNQPFSIEEFYPIEKSHSYIGFSIKYMGYAMVKGRFERFKGAFRYDQHDISKISVSLSINANSIDTDSDWRDKDLKSNSWFDAEKYPFITFVSSSVKSTDVGFEITGDLTIKEITKKVTIQMDPASGVLRDIRGDSQVIFTGKTIINRTDFGVEGKNWSAVKEGISGVAKEVYIEISILCKRINKDNHFNSWIRDETNPSGKLYKEISTNGKEECLRMFDELMAQSGLKLNYGVLDDVGYMLLKEDKVNDALAIFKKNIQAYPDKSEPYFSYAEALATAGNLKEAKLYYKESLSKDPNNWYAREILRHLE